MYALKYSDWKKIDLAQELIKYINQSYFQLIADSDLMNQKTKLQAYKKLEKMKYQIGYPNEVFYEDIVNLYYESLNMSDDDYLENQLNIQKVSIHDGAYFREPINNDYIPSTIMANAFYFPYLNGIEVPFGIMSEPFFDVESPMYLNFGAFGFIIGHEMTHGFDDSGRARDFEGKYQFNLQNRILFIKTLV